jgi:hypothetical protein
MKKWCFITALTALIVGVGALSAQDRDDQIQALEKQINALKVQLDKIKEANDRPAWLDKIDRKGLTLNFYGETKWNIRNGADYGDPHRFVLIPGYKLSDYAYFNSEIEIEHGGVDDSDGGRFDGELELEQFYADVNINDWINWRSLGVSLIPLGTINLYHEPNQFYSVHRPIMYNKVIPSTWMETGMGFFGEVPNVDGLSYFLYASSGISSAYATHGTDGSWNIRSTRPGLREKDGNDSLAWSARLAYERGGFAGSASTYLADYQYGGKKTNLQLFDVEASYRFENNLELIADYAWWNIDDPTVMQDNQVGERMDGYRLELAYHHAIGSNELVPFIRAEGYDLSSGGGYAGFTEAGSKNYLTYGAMYKLGGNMELKAAIRQSFDDDDRTEFSFGVGFQF